MTENSHPPGYIPALDGLRGIAVLAVMIFHTGAPFLKGGYIGVDIFFVLSGFLITSVLINEYGRSKRISLKSFYMRRVLRLAPALIALLLVFCVISVAVLSEQEARKNLVDSLISLTYLTNWARAFNIHPPTYLGHTWSLSIEEQFYLLWPIVLIALLKLERRRLYVPLAALLIALFSWWLRVYLSVEGESVHRLYNGLDTRIDALMVGCALGAAVSLGLVQGRWLRWVRTMLPLATPLAVAGLVLFALATNWYDPNMLRFGYFAVALLAAILILDCYINTNSMLCRALTVPWLMWLGSISYGAYLWHYPIYRALYTLGFELPGVFVIGIPSTLLLAAVSYYKLEQPILTLKKRYIRATLKTNEAAAISRA